MSIIHLVPTTRLRQRRNLRKQADRHLIRPIIAALLPLLAHQPASAEVLDLDRGTYTTRKVVSRTVVKGVLDLDRPPPPEVEEQRVAAIDPDAERLVIKPSKRVAARVGRPEVEDMIVEVGMKYADHPGIRKAGLTSTEWLMLFRANIAIESNFHQSALSSVGAIGLGQLMPATAEQLGVDPYDAKQNLDGSARYLLTQLHDFGSAELALAAYNAGPGAVLKYGGIPPYEETKGHVSKVLSVYETSIPKETSQDE